MAKKSLAVLVFTALVAGGAFAIDMSAGLGGNFAVNFDSFKFEYDGEKFDMSRTMTGGGFSAFFDATFVEANIGMLFGGTKLKYDGESFDDASESLSYLTLGLFGKYPFNLGAMSLFPLLGVQFDIGLSAKDNDGKAINFEDWEDTSKADYMNRIWIKLGVGADFNLSNRLYLRPSFLYGINFGSKYDRDMKKDTKDEGGKASSFHHGLDLRVALGFKF